MSIGRLFCIGLIFLLGAGGWFVLGERLVQSAPLITVAVPGTNRTRAVPASVVRVDVHLTLQHRRKDLLWFSTYATGFVGA